MLTLFRQLITTKRLTFRGIYWLVISLLLHKTNLIALLYFVSRLHGRKKAFTSEERTYTYHELWQNTQSLTNFLAQKHQVGKGQKVAVLCSNHLTLVQSLFAFAQLGADIYLLNVEMTAQQFALLQTTYRFDKLCLDSAYRGLLGTQTKPEICIFAEEIEAEVNHFPQNKIKTQRAGKVIILTGGTTGAPKTAQHKPSFFNFLTPFLALLADLRLHTYRKVYIPLPLYHGFGLSALFVSMLLGAHIRLSRKFEAEAACQLIKKAEIEVITVVPLMLQRMLAQDAAKLKGLKLILSGGAILHKELANKALDLLGEKVANLYGTSEGGFCVLATPQDLRKHPDSIGKAIEGAKLDLWDESGQIISQTGQIGRLWVSNRWSVKDRADKGIDTGDLAYKNAEGYLFLCGRSDEMIVSGGENVFPLDLENILLQHPHIQEVAVIGIPDEDFGQRLYAFVVPKQAALSEAEILSWCKSHCARYQQPKQVELLDALPYTPLGKTDKKRLRAYWEKKSV